MLMELYVFSSVLLISNKNYVGSSLKNLFINCGVAKLGDQKNI